MTGTGRMTDPDTPPEPADHELRYVAPASLSICVECGEMFETADLRP